MKAPQSLSGLMWQTAFIVLIASFVFHLIPYLLIRYGHWILVGIALYVALRLLINRRRGW